MGFEIVCLSPTRWRQLWQRPQQVLSRMAALGHRILYVDPPTVGSRKDVSRYLHEQSAWDLRLRERLPNLTTLEPVRFMQGSFAGRLRRDEVADLNTLVRLVGLRRAMERLGFTEPVLWVYLPEAARFAGRLGESMLVYDCVDMFPAFPGATPEKARGAEELARRADVMFCASRSLLAVNQPLNPRAELVPNAVDVDFFDLSLATRPLPVLADRGPVVGFLGAIYEWVDTGLLAGVATGRPDWTIAMVGPVAGEHAALRGCPNVVWCGPVEYTDVPAYIGAMDVCLIPFAASEVTYHSNPIKVYEYLAAGKPVVATPLPELEQFADVLTLAAGVEATVSAIDACLREEATAAGPALRGKRREAVRRHHWDQRVAQMLAAMEDHRKGVGALAHHRVPADH
ncbi:MAG: glycosyltransferase [Bacillota bacterium]